MGETEGRQDEGEKGLVKHPHPKTVSKTQDGTESTDFTAIIGKIDKHLSIIQKMMIILKPFLNKSRVKEGPTCKRDCIIVSSLKGRQACLDTKDNN